MTTTMLQRLGQVLYWTGCGAAVVALLAGMTGCAMSGPGEGMPVFIAAAIFAALAWAAGRACRYVLAGT